VQGKSYKRLSTSQELSQWNNFLASTKDCSILQSVEWGDFKHHFGWTPLRIGAFDGERLVGGISVLKRKIPLPGKTLFYAPRGPVLNPFDPDTFTGLIEEIRKIAKEHNAVALKIDPEIEETDSSEIEIIKKNGFHFVPKQIQPRVTFFIDLSRSLDNILASFKSKTRYNIRLSQKRGVEIKEMTSVDGLDIFYEIYQNTAKRDTFIIHPYEYYKILMDLMAARSMVHIFIAFYEGVPLAGVYIFAFGYKVWYMYGASSDKHRDVMPNYALHWEVIKWAKKHGYKIYDLWGIPANPNPSHPLYGVYRFKKGFDGELKRFIGAYDLPFQPVWYSVMNKGITAYTNLRSLRKKGKISDSLGE
jgi:lipid II:glycine glycyltransferase (peptidoglycan interpeptide bridge formation enzyme)